jgi:hypothetical protein
LPYLRCGQLSFGGHVDPLAIKQIKLKVIKKLMMCLEAFVLRRRGKREWSFSGKSHFSGKTP